LVRDPESEEVFGQLDLDFDRRNALAGAMSAS
jgi:hypothetical protein